MTVRDSGAQALAARCAAARPGHVRARPGLINEDQFCRIEAGLILEPIPAPPQDVRAALLGGVRRLFFSVIRRRWKKRHSVPMPAETPTAASSNCISPSVTSDRLSTKRRIKGAWASMCFDRCRLPLNRPCLNLRARWRLQRQHSCAQHSCAGAATHGTLQRLQPADLTFRQPVARMRRAARDGYTSPGSPGSGGHPAHVRRTDQSPASAESALSQCRCAKPKIPPSLASKKRR